MVQGGEIPKNMNELFLLKELMRVYGALMWAISKVISVPECPKVFIGSFWDQQLKHDLYRRLFERELQCLFDDLQVGGDTIHNWI